MGNKDGLNNVQLIMMGNGEPCFRNMLMWAETRWKGRVCGYAGFCPHVEREIIAGSDFFLMPSRYEPCGIPQMCAMTYGTIPLVHATGFHILPLNEASFKSVMFDAIAVFFRSPEVYR